MVTLPPIVQEFQARVDTSHLVGTARAIARHLTLLADDLTGAAEPQDGAAFAPAEPDDGLATFEVRLRGTSQNPGHAEHVRALQYRAEDGWVTFHGSGACSPGAEKVAMYAAEAVESVWLVVQ